MGRPQTKFNKQEHKAKLSQIPSMHVSNLPKEYFSEIELKKFLTFAGYKVKYAKVVKSLQYGYVTFMTEEDLERCLREMNNYKLNGLHLCLTRASSDPRAVQEEKEQNNNSNESP